MLETIRAALNLVSESDRRSFAGVVAFAVLVSIAEASGAVLVLALLRLLVEPDDTTFPLVGDVARFTPGGIPPITFVALCFFVVFVVRIGGSVLLQHMTLRTAERAGADLSTSLVRGYLSMPWEFHLERNSSEIVRNALITVNAAVGGVLMPLLNVCSASVVAIFMLGVLLVTSPLATAGAVFVMGVSSLLTLKVIQPRLERLGQQAQQANLDVHRYLQQGTGAVRDIQLHGREDHFADRFAAARSHLGRTMQLRGVLSALPRAVVELAFLTFVLVAMVVATVQEAGAEIFPVLGVLAYAGLRLQPQLSKLTSAANSLRYTRPAVDDLTRDLDAMRRAQEARRRQDRDLTPRPLHAEVVLRGVGYRYPGADDEAVRDVDLIIRAGERFGLCGPTGGGKSTIADLLAGVLVPQRGEVLVDGVAIGSDVRSWQRSIAMVHQHPTLIDDTVRRNVALGIDDADIDDAQVWDALDQAELGDHVRGLSAGLDTEIGERGVRFSGGQRQRVALARALYRRPSLLLLDEGTSALDTGTERDVMRTILALPQGVTVVTVAHRLSTLEDCERVAFVRDGRVEAVGSLDDLEAGHAGFRSMVGDPAAG